MPQMPQTPQAAYLHYNTEAFWAFQEQPEALKQLQIQQSHAQMSAWYVWQCQLQASMMRDLQLQMWGWQLPQPGASPNPSAQAAPAAAPPTGTGTPTT